jgi:hypothetical protein
VIISPVELKVPATGSKSSALAVAWGLHRDLPFQPSAAEVKKKRMQDNNKDDPVSRC